MRILIATARQDDRTFAKTVRAMLEALTMAARDECDVAGPLYGSKVRYGKERGGRESFVTPVHVRAAGQGDCAHLSLWRVAELRNAGVPATYDILILPHKNRGRRTFHVRVRHPDGAIEDPSIRLGMKVPEGMVIPV